MEDSFLKIWNVLGTLDQMVLRAIHFDVHDMHMQAVTEMEASGFDQWTSRSSTLPVLWISKSSENKFK